MRKRILSLTLSFAVLLSSMSMSAVSVSSANVEETAGTQLQTILLDNDGKNLWVTESWGGANIIPNTIWTTSDLYDYFYNGSLSFEVQSSGQTSFPFRIGITSHSHNEDVTVNWTDLEKYQNAVTASPEWTSYTLPLYDLAEIISEKGFDKHNVWKISVGAVPSGESASFRNMKISSDDEERQYPFIKVNQVGYTCEGEKNAKVSCFAKFGSLSGKRYEVVNKDSGKVAYSNMLSDAVADETISGESVYEINFDAVIDEGTYFIRIPNADLNTSALTPRDKEEDLKTDTIVSVPFEIGDDVYDEMLSDMSKYYYYQRQGIDLEEKYAGEFARKNLHPNDVSVRRWSDRDNPNAETFDVSQGWYDAGDYGKYVSPAATSVENLLLAYELFPQEFRKLDPNILETEFMPIAMNKGLTLIRQVIGIPILLRFSARSNGNWICCSSWNIRIKTARSMSLPITRTVRSTLKIPCTALRITLPAPRKLTCALTLQQRIWRQCLPMRISSIKIFWRMPTLQNNAWKLLSVPGTGSQILPTKNICPLVRQIVPIHSHRMNWTEVCIGQPVLCIVPPKLPETMQMCMKTI